jgi:muconolactone delta-isomerase
MVDIKLPEFISEEFVSLIPYQRSQVNRLMGRGVLNSYSLSLDRGRIWTVVNADTQKDAERTLNTFPLMKFMSYDIYKLAFNNNISQILPKFSLN